MPSIFGGLTDLTKEVRDGNGALLAENFLNVCREVIPVTGERLYHGLRKRVCQILPKSAIVPLVRPEPGLAALERLLVQYKLFNTVVSLSYRTRKLVTGKVISADPHICKQTNLGRRS